MDIIDSLFCYSESHASHITSFYRTFGCPIICTDTYSQCYFVIDTSSNAVHWLVRTPYLLRKASNVTVENRFKTHSRASTLTLTQKDKANFHNKSLLSQWVENQRNTVLYFSMNYNDCRWRLLMVRLLMVLFDNAVLLYRSNIDTSLLDICRLMITYATNVSKIYKIHVWHKRT